MGYMGRGVEGNEHGSREGVRWHIAPLEWIIGIECWATPDVPFRTTFRSFKDGEPIYQTIELAAKTLPQGKPKRRSGRPR